MADIFDILRPGATFTGRALRDAIVQVGQPPSGGRGVRVTSFGPGLHTVPSTKRRVVAPKSVRVPAVIQGERGHSATLWADE